MSPFLEPTASRPQLSKSLLIDILVIFEVEGSAAQQNSSMTDHMKAPSECATTKNGS